MRLRHLDADRSTADHDQMLWQLAVGKNGLVGQVGHIVKPTDPRYRGLRTGRDHKAPRANFDIPGAHRAAARKASLGTQDPHPEAFEALYRIIWRNLGDHPLDAVGNCSEIYVRTSIGDA
jgi:hypothetical protein